MEPPFLIDWGIFICFYIYNKIIIMKKEEVLGIVRHILTFIGGVVVAKGIVNESQLLEICGAIMTIIGSVWSVADKRKK
jgi:hypothetical protein